MTSRLFKVVVGYVADEAGTSRKHRVNQYIWESDALGTTVEHKAMANVEEDHPGCEVWVEEDPVEVGGPRVGFLAAYREGKVRGL